VPFAPHRADVFLIAIVMLLAALTPGWAQGSTASHPVTITIPEQIGIRIVGPGTGPRVVEFDYGSDLPAYLAAAAAGTPLLPTAVRRIDDVQVNVSRNGRWYVFVQATPFAYNGPAAGAGLDLSAITVRRGAHSGLTQNAISGPGGSATYELAWQLSTALQQIATRTGNSGGWRSLGFNGLDYELTVDGSADPGSYRTVVTYSVSSP
jgi:hypothetical protein